MTEWQLKLDLPALLRFIDESFPKAARPALGQLIALAPGHARLALTPDATMLRPGNIVSGPTLMGLADVAAWAVVLGHIGPVPMAVTSNMAMAFLRPCRMEPVTADARLLKLGRRIAVIDVRIWQDAEDRPVAQATFTYALP